MKELRLYLLATALTVGTYSAQVQTASAQDSAPSETLTVDPDALFAEALTRYQRGGVSRAYNEFKQVVALVPTHTNALYNVASIAATQDRLGDCVLYTYSYLSQVPDDPDAETLRSQLNECSRSLEQSGALTITADEADTLIMVNGLIMNPEAMGTMILPTGDYTVNATLRDHEPFSSTISLTDSAELTVAVQLSSITYYGNVVVVYEEPGAEVTVNGQSVGTTPLGESLRLAEGRYLLGVTRPGFHPWSRYVDVTRDTEVLQDIRLLDESIDLDDL